MALPPKMPAAPPDADDLESEVKPLSAEERRRLFDLPPVREPDPAPTQRATPPEEPLELARDVRRWEMQEEPERRASAVRAVVSGAIGALRLAVTGIAFGVLFFAFLAFVYRH